jgi:hypothetical protein
MGVAGNNACHITKGYKMAKRNNKQPQVAAQAPAVQPVAPVAAPVVALRGGLAIAAVALTGKPYRTKAQHNAAWWQQITTAQGGSVQALIAAGVPSHFVAYTVRRGYLAPAAADAQ